MRARARAWLAWLGAALAVGAAASAASAQPPGSPNSAAPSLVADVSQHVVAVNQEFAGTQLLLFGALVAPGGGRPPADTDIVVVVEGPERPVVLREKRKFAGVWVNADSASFETAPSFYALAASRPIAGMVNDQTAAIYELGLQWLQLSPSGSIDPATQQRFAAGLVGLMSRHGLYHEDDHGVTMTGHILYRANILLPSSVATGTYSAETFAIRHGRVIASALAHIEVRKQGFALAIADFAAQHGGSYGLFAVAAAVLMGWLAGRLFALI